MTTVAKQRFLRIQASHDQWRIGLTRSIRADYNELTKNWRRSSAFQFHQPSGEKAYADFILLSLMNQLDASMRSGNTVVPMNIEKLLKPLDTIRLAFTDLMTAAREFVFEDVRSKEFNDRPSRMKCLYLCPNRPECVKYWWRTLELQAQDPWRKIWEVEATGNAFIAPPEMLDLHTISIEEWEGRARQYWSSHDAESDGDEVLFVGDIEVIAERDKAGFGI